MTYIELCESIFQKWVNKDFTAYDNYMFNHFQLDFCPEPYLTLKGSAGLDNNKTLYFLTTNPGNGEEFQHIDSLDKNILSSNITYKENSDRLSAIYVESINSAKINHKARGRILDILKIGEEFENIVQVETFPFHSSSLPINHKLKIVNNYYNKANFTFTYLEALKKFLSNKTVIAISSWNPDWFNFQKDILLPETLKEISICEKNGNTTGKFVFGISNNSFKGLTKIQGNNNLPADTGKNIIISELSRLRNHS